MNKPKSIFEIIQQTRQHQPITQLLEQVKGQPNRTLVRYLYHHLMRYQVSFVYLKRWVLDQVIGHLPLPKMKPAEWLTLGLSAGLMAGSLLQPANTVAQEINPIGSEFQVNSYTTGGQVITDIGMDANGNYVIIWGSGPIARDEVGQDGSDFGIYGQRYNALDLPQGSEFRVNSYTTGGQGWSSVAMNQDGNFVAVWDSGYFIEPSQDGSDSGIFAQLYSANGIPQGSEFQVNTYTTDKQYRPDVAMDSEGNFVITWSGTGADDSHGIYAKRYNASGAALDDEFLVNTNISWSHYVPQVAMDEAGNFVIVWESGELSNEENIYGRQYNSAGVPQTDEFQINSYTSKSQCFPKVAMDQNGDFVVTWFSGLSYDPGQDGSTWGIFARRFNASGAALGSDFQVNTYTTGYQTFSSVAMDQDGDFVIVWQSIKDNAVQDDDISQDGSHYGVFAQQYNASGIPIGGEFQVNTYTTGPQGGSLGSRLVAMDAEGNFVIGWPTGNQDGSSWGVFARRYAAPISQPKIIVSGNGVEITDGDSSPVNDDHTDFGNVLANSGSTQRTFTISNIGSANLTLGTIEISGTHKSDFAVTLPSTTTIETGQNITFTIHFTPTALGLRTAEVSVVNNDDGESPHNFAIQGTGITGSLIYLPLVIKP